MKQKVKDILREHVHQHEYSVNPEEIFVGALAAIKKDKKDRKRYLFGFLLFFCFSIFIKLQVASLDSDFLGLNNSDALIGEVYIAPIETKTTYSSEQENSLSQVNTIKNITSSASPANEKNKSSNEQQDGVVKSPTAELNKVNQLLISNSQAKARPGINQQSESKDLKSMPVENEVVKNSTRTSGLFDIAASKYLRKANKENTQESSVNLSERNAINQQNIKVGSIIQNEEKNNVVAVVSEIEKERNDVAVFGPVETFLSKLIIDDRALIEQEFMVGNLTEVKSVGVKSKFALSLIASYGLFKKDLVANEEAYLAYTNARGRYETELEVLSTKLLLSYKVSNKLRLSSGIKYQRFNEQFSWAGNYFVDQVGEQIDISQDNLIGVPFYQEVDRELSVYNKHEVVSVPLLIGLYHKHRAISFGINVGPSFEFYSSSTGQSLGYFSQGFNEVNIPIAAQDQLMQFGLGLEANLEFGIGLGRGIEFMTELSAQRLVSQEQYLSSDFNSLSLGVGLRKSL